MSEVKSRKPWSFYMCSLTFSFERAAYYSAKWLIFTYLAVAMVSGGMGESGLGIDKGQAAVMQSYLVGLTYLAPILMGVIADRFIGARYLIPLGLVIMGIGYVYAGYVGTYSSMWFMVIVVSIGTGFFKSNLSAVTGSLFKTEAQVNDAFSTMYSFINVGAFIGTSLVGILYVKLATATSNGYLQCFKIAGVLCILGAIWFVLGWKALGDVGKKPFKQGEKKEEKKENTIPLQPYEWRRIISIVIISGLSVVFWTFWYLTYVIMYDYMPKFVDDTLGGFKVPTSWLDAENSLVCIILGPVLGMLWIKMSKRPQGDISLYKKLSIGLLLLSASFAMLVFAEFQRGIGAPESAKASLLWIVAFFIFFSIGEMVFSPLGYAFVAEYSPKRILSIMMAVWIVATFVAAQGYGIIYSLIANLDIVKVSLGIISILVVLAIVLIIFDKKLSSLVQLKEGEVLVEE